MKNPSTAMYGNIPIGVQPIALKGGLGKKVFTSPKNRTLMSGILGYMK